MRARSIVKLAALVAAGGLLVATAVAGTRAASRLELEFRPFLAVPADVLELGLLVAAALCVPVLLLGMILRRRAKRDGEGGDLEWLRRLVFLAVVVAAVVVLRELLPSADERDAAADDAVRSPVEAVDVLGWSGRAAVLAVVLAGIAAAVLWWRAQVMRNAAAEGTTVDADREEAAVRAGQAVLDQRWDDPRAAVVGCYAAMEAVLAATGTPRHRGRVARGTAPAGDRGGPPAPGAWAPAHRAVPGCPVFVRARDVRRRRGRACGAGQHRPGGSAVTFGNVADFPIPVSPGPRRRPLPRPRRTVPRWPLFLLLAGALVAGPVGPLVATSVAGAIVVLRLRVLVADPDVPDLPALPWRRQAQAPVLPGFTRTVGSVEWGLASAFDFDTSLCPRLTRVAAMRLTDRHGVDLDAQPTEAARLLGAEAWALLDPARPAAPDRSTPGPDRAALARVLDAIERI